MSVKMSHMEIASAAPTGLPKGRLYIQICPVPSRRLPLPRRYLWSTWREFPPRTVKQILGYNSRLRRTN